MTVRAAGWPGTENVRLLALAATKFDFFLTAEQNPEFQQNPNMSPIAVLVIHARNNRIQALAPLVPEVSQAFNHISPWTLRKVGVQRIAR
jgi:hypothetical protein